MFKKYDNGLKSNRTKLSIPKVINDDNDDDFPVNFVFNESFSNLFDIIHLSLSIHFPLIIVGEDGNG